MQCAHPITIKASKSGDPMLLPCGRCIMCKKMKALDWTIRLKHENATHQGRSVFITLTYSDINLPFDLKGNPCLKERDVQLFMKKLRKRYSSFKFKYFYCAEYGTRTNRPHYHMILFGLPPKEFDIRLLRMKGDINIYTSYVINDLWTLGENQIGYISDKRISYTAGYVIEKMTDRRLHLVKPYCRASKGLGLEYVKKYSDRLIKNKYIEIDGRKVNIPRYYIKKFDIDCQTTSLKKLIEKYKRDKGYAESNNLSTQILINLAHEEDKQREETYKAKLLRKNREI